MTVITQQVVDRIVAAGGRPLIVGGSVRDAVIADRDGTRFDPKDIDIEVHGNVTPDQVAAAMRTVGRVDEVGAQFGVLKVSAGDEDFDVSFPRADSKPVDGTRWPTVTVDNDLDETAASARRDFTVNAVMWDPVTGELVDPHGGLIDLDNRVLRHTSEAFADDPLRVLRGVGFAGRLGFDLHPDTIVECRRIVDDFGLVATERCWTEWHKIGSKAAHPSKSLEALTATGWVRHYPQLAELAGVPQDARWHPEGDVDVHTGLVADAAAAVADREGLVGDDRVVVVFGAVAHDFGKVTHTQIVRDVDGSVEKVTSHGHAEAGVDPTVKFLVGVGAPKHLVDRIVPLVREHMCCAGVDEPTPAAVRRLARRLQPATLVEWAYVVEADHAGRGSGSGPSPADAWLQVAAAEEVTVAPQKSIVDGAMLIARGMKPGPEFKPVLAAALEAQDAGVIHDETTARAWLDNRLNG